jgi:hypothetical protein
MCLPRDGRLLWAIPFIVIVSFLLPSRLEHDLPLLMRPTENVEQLYAFFYTLPRSPVTPKTELKTLSPAVGKGTESTTASPLNVTSPLEVAASSSEEQLDAPPSAVPSEPAVGWESYNPRAEFARQGVGSRTKTWRFTDINRDYTFSPTYPSKLVVPARISDAHLTYAAKYRSKARIPALSYLHWANHVSDIGMHCWCTLR